MKYHRRIFFILVSSLFVLDQVTKASIRHWMPPASTRPKKAVIDGFFNIVHAENTGAAWGILGESEHRMLFFTVVTLVAFVMILGYFRNLRPDDKLLAISLSAVFAGAAGNFADRLIFQKVTDFLHFYLSGGVGDFVADKLGTSYWPAFNVADICINVGVGLFIWHVLFIEGKREAAERAAEEAAASDPGEASATTAE